MHLSAAFIELSQQVRTLAMVVEQLEVNIPVEQGDSPSNHAFDVGQALKQLEERVRSEGLDADGGVF